MTVSVDLSTEELIAAAITLLRRIRDKDAEAIDLAMIQGGNWVRIMLLPESGIRLTFSQEKLPSE